jgi:hypothetical protein
MAGFKSNRKHETTTNIETTELPTAINETIELQGPVAEPSAITEPETKVDETVVTEATEAAVTETKVMEPTAGKVYTEEQKPYLNKSSVELFSMFGGEQSRGAISLAIRTLTAVGFSRGEVAKMLNKRYQHVRNVLIEAARSAESNERKKTIAARNVTLASVNIQSSESESESPKTVD